MSQFDNSVEILERTQEKIKRLELYKEFITTNAKLIDEQDGKYCFVNNEYAERVSFELKEGDNFEERLTEARAFMRELLGSWKDEVNSIWNPYGEQVVVSWGDESHTYQLWMECTLDTFPKSLYPSKKCSWVPDRPTTKALVCEVK